MADAKFTSQTVRDFWNQFLAQVERPEEAESRFLEAFKVGDCEEDADEGGQLIFSGAKTATSSLLWEYQSAGMNPPAEGDLSIVLDGRGDPVCVVETTWTAVLPFAQVDEQLARDYGEWDGTLETWREECWAYYAVHCRDLNREPSEDMPLVCERFRVVYPTFPGDQR